MYGYDDLYSKVDFGNYQEIFDHISGLSADDKVDLKSFFDLITPLPLDGNEDIANALLEATKWENMYLKDPDNISNLHVLGAVSVAKYSLYWYALNESLILPGKVRWWHVLADAVGGVIGGAAGSGGGPCGVIIGALEGAAAGTTIYDLCSS